MSGHGAKLPRKMEEAIAALLTQRNIDEAAKSIGVATKTLLRWMKDPQFDAAYRKARRLAFGQSVARLQQASGAAVSTLLKIMVDPAAPHSTRVPAAASVLDHSSKSIEIEDIEARLTDLERAADAPKQARRETETREIEPPAAHRRTRRAMHRRQRPVARFPGMAVVLAGAGPPLRNGPAARTAHA